MGDQKADHSASADADLVLRARSGDTEAFAELWRRHHVSGLTVARSVTSSIDPDDLVQEAYARIYQAILKGGGPNGSFRAYLFTSIRNTAAAWGRSRREVPIDEMDAVVDPHSTDSAADEALDRGLTAQAFRSLPSRWQEVLWYSEIEQMKPAEIAPLLGMTAGAVSQLTFRAREGLREAWIQAHLRSVAEGSECQWTIEHLGAHSRGNLGPRAQQRIDAHLASCTRCIIVAAEAKDVSGRLAIVILPLVLGAGAASSYLATLQGGGAPIVALAAMPAGVVDVATIGGTTSSVGAPMISGAGAVPPSMGGAEAAGAAGSGGTGAGAGSVAGIGALVGAGSAALVVAGVVAAVAVVPALTSAGSATSSPSASLSDSSAITSEVNPDTSKPLENPLVIEVDDEPPAAPSPLPGVEAAPPAAEATPSEPAAPETPPAPEPSPKPTVTPEPSPTVTPEPTPTVTPKPTPTVTPKPTPTVTPKPTPTVTPKPTPTVTPTAPPTPTPTPTPVPEPEQDLAPIVWDGQREVWVDDEGKTHYVLPVSGTPNAVVQAWLGGSPGGGDEITLDSQGEGLIDLRPNAWQIALGAELGLRYVVDGEPGEWTYFTIKGFLSR